MAEKSKKYGLVALVLAVVAILIVFCWPGTPVESDEVEPAIIGTPKTKKVANNDWFRVDDQPKAAAATDETEEEEGEVITSFSGKIVDSTTGAAISGARITFTHEGKTKGVSSRGDGSFFFLAHEEGLYTLDNVKANGYLTTDGHGSIAQKSFMAQHGLEINDIVIVLQPVAELFGLVVNQEHDPVANAKVCMKLRGGVKTEGCVTSDADGHFTIQAPPQVILEASHENYRSGVTFRRRNNEEPVVIVLGENIEGQNLFTINGQVVDEEGNPLKDVLVQAIKEEVDRGDPKTRPSRHAIPMAEQSSTVSDEDGHFKLEKLTEGTFNITGRYDGYRVAIEQGVTTGRDDVVLTMSTGYVVSGQVTDQETGAPVQSYSVMITKLGRHNRPKITQVYDVEGRYKITGLTQEIINISISAQGYAASDERRLNPLNDKPMEANFALVGGGRVFGTIIDSESGEPIGGALVGPENFRGAAATFNNRAISDPNGNFEFYGLPIGTRSLEVTASGYDIKLVSGLQVDPSGSVGPLTIELSPRNPENRPRREMTGIGAVLGKRGDGVMVMQLLPDSAGAQAGLKKGDLVLKVDGTDVGENNFQDVVELIRGEEGSDVVLSIRHRDGSEEEVTVTRGKFKN